MKKGGQRLLLIEYSEIKKRGVARYKNVIMIKEFLQNCPQDLETNPDQEIRMHSYEFSQRVTCGFKKPERKWAGEMLYGILKSKDVKLTHIGRALKENTKMKHSKKRLSRNVSRKDISEKLLDSYLLTGKKPVGSFNPIPSLQIHFLLDKLPSKSVNLPIILIRVCELIFGRRKSFW